MTDRFERDVEAGLAGLAGEAGPPPADFHARVHARVAVHRRRRAATLTAAVAACAAAAWALAPLAIGGTTTRYPVLPAAGGPPESDWSTSAGGAWWPLSDPLVPAAPAVVTAYWDKSDLGLHTDVRLLIQQDVGQQVFLVVTGRRASNDQARLALLLGERTAGGAIAPQGIRLLDERPAPAQLSAPLAVAVTYGPSFPGAAASTSTMDVLAAPCTGRTQVFGYPGGQALATRDSSRTGPVVVALPKPAAADRLAVSCTVAPLGATTFNLSAWLIEPAAKNTIISLFLTS